MAVRREIAEKISQVLADSGLNTELIPVKKVQNVNDYAGVVLGSAVYMGNWRREARKFLYFKGEGTDRDTSVVFFQRSCWGGRPG